MYSCQLYLCLLNLCVKREYCEFIQFRLEAFFAKKKKKTINERLCNCKILFGRSFNERGVAIVPRSFSNDSISFLRPLTHAWNFNLHNLVLSTSRCLWAAYNGSFAIAWFSHHRLFLTVTFHLCERDETLIRFLRIRFPSSFLFSFFFLEVYHEWQIDMDSVVQEIGRYRSSREIWRSAL